MVEPDFKSATASSASLNNFDLVRSITGCASSCWDTAASCHLAREDVKYRTWPGRGCLVEESQDPAVLDNWRAEADLRGRSEETAEEEEEELVNLRSLTHTSSVRRAVAAMVSNVVAFVG